MPAGLLLNFFLEEIGPVDLQQGRSPTSQARLQSSRCRILSGELCEDEFQYWPRVEAKLSAQMIAVIDYKAGNLTSVVKALRFLDARMWW